MTQLDTDWTIRTNDYYVSAASEHTCWTNLLAYKLYSVFDLSQQQRTIHATNEQRDSVSISVESS